MRSTGRLTLLLAAAVACVLCQKMVSGWPVAGRADLYSRELSLGWQVVQWALVPALSSFGYSGSRILTC